MRLRRELRLGLVDALLQDFWGLRLWLREGVLGPLPKCHDQYNDRFEQYLLRLKRQLMELVYSFSPNKALKERMLEVIKEFEESCRRGWQGDIYWCQSAARTSSWYCGCLRRMLHEDMSGDFWEEFVGAQRRIEGLAQEAQAQQRPAWWRDPAFWRATLEAATAILVTLIGGAVGAAATRLGLAPATAEAVLAVFWSRNDEWERKFSPWVEERMQQLADQLSTISTPTVGELASGEYVSTPMTTPTVGELADPNALARDVYDLHISEIEQWVEEFVREQAQIIGEA